LWVTLMPNAYLSGKILLAKMLNGVKTANCIFSV
jgi:hypothetical protein